MAIRRWLIGVVLGTVLVGAAALGYAYWRGGLYGINVLLARGGSIWINVTPDDPRLTEGVRLALKGAAPTAGEAVWADRAPGFETAEIPVLMEGKPVDRLLVARVDPARWRFSVHSAPAGDRTLDDWMRELGAALVVNGSYFDPYGEPVTPLRSQGRDLGPRRYASSHGAFVASDETVGVIDMKGRDWRSALKAASNAMVSYPLLLDETGASRALPSRWLANRSFVAQDKSGRILIGTTTDGSLTLARLAELLASPSLGLALALNLDGGPVACQGVVVADFRRRVCGNVDIKVDEDGVRVLRPILPGKDRGLPIVLAVTAK